jgi:heme-degrading monooxygenase HmoA
VADASEIGVDRCDQVDGSAPLVTRAGGQYRRLAEHDRRGNCFDEETSDIADTVIARFSGDPADLAARYQRQFAALMEAAGPTPPPGLIAHTCTRTADGLVIVDAWESADQWRAMAASEEFRSSLAEFGLPEPQVEFGELINVFRTEQVAG